MYVRGRKTAVINCYQKDMVLINREWLEEESLYIFTRPGHEAVDFYGRLLQKMLKHCTRVEWQARDLGKKAREIKRLKTTK
jgi:hypothetical protein